MIATNLNLGFTPFFLSFFSFSFLPLILCTFFKQKLFIGLYSHFFFMVLGLLAVAHGLVIEDTYDRAITNGRMQIADGFRKKSLGGGTAERLN